MFSLKNLAPKELSVMYIQPGLRCNALYNHAIDRKIVLLQWFMKSNSPYRISQIKSSAKSLFFNSIYLVAGLMFSANPHREVIQWCYPCSFHNGYVQSQHQGKTLGYLIIISVIMSMNTYIISLMTPKLAASSDTTFG